MDRGAWWAPAHGVTELDMTEGLSRSWPHIPQVERQKALLPQAEELKTSYQIPIRSCMRRSCENMCPRALERQKWQGI